MEERIIVEKSCYKYCIVPMCKNTTVTAPDKYFFLVPRDASLRNNWCKAMRRSRDKLSPNSGLYCCEDHFNIEEDTQNYIQYKIMALQEGHKVILRLKKGVLPHKFQCQKDVKLECTQETEEALVESDTPTFKCNVLVTYSNRSKSINISNQNISMPTVLNNIKKEKEDEDEVSQIKMEFEEGPTTVGTEKIKDCETDPSTSTLYCYEHNVKIEPTEFSDNQMDCKAASTTGTKGGDRKNSENQLYFEVSPITTPLNVTKETRKRTIYMAEKCVQANIVKKYRSKGVIANIHLKQKSDAATMTSDYLLLDFEPSCLKGESIKSNIQFKQLMRSSMITATEREPEMFLGVPKNYFYIINLLSEMMDMPNIDILITLRKIKLNEPINILALYFGYTEGTITRIFLRSVPYIAEKLKEMILWPKPTEIFQNLPASLSQQYSNVVAVIDYLELQTENLSNIDDHSVAGSQNKLKYLISCTARGLIDFVSSGYSGATNAMIVEESGFLGSLPPDKAVMADTDFEDISSLLQDRNCTLVEPPLVSRATSGIEDIEESERILTYHDQCVMKKLREFSILQPHVCVDHNLLPIIDDVILIACCLINISSTRCFIKKIIL